MILFIYSIYYDGVVGWCEGVQSTRLISTRFTEFEIMSSQMIIIGVREENIQSISSILHMNLNT